MFLMQKQPIFFYQLMIISYLLVGCGVNKIRDCNQIILNIAEANSLIDQYKNPADPVAMEQLTKQLDQIVKKLNKIKPRDQQLQQFIKDLIQDFQVLSKGLTEMSQALEMGKKASSSVAGRNQFEQAKSQLSKATKNISDLPKKQERLTNELVAYCQK